MHKAIFAGKWCIGRAIVQDAVESADPITPADLFPFIVCARLIMDGAFIYPAVQPRHDAGHFGFKAKTIFTQIGNDLEQRFPTKQFIACFHIAKIKIGEHVRNEGQGTVHPGMPKVEHAPCFLPQVPRAIHHICLILDQRLQQFQIVQGLVLGIGILDAYNIPR